MAMDPLAMARRTPAPQAITHVSQILLPSRAVIHSELLQGLSESRGWFLLTGEAGTGKTLLLERLAESLPPGWEPVLVELSPDSSPATLLAPLGDLLSISGLPGLPDPLGLLRTALGQLSNDSCRVVLLIDEAQNASDSVLEMVRLLSSRIGDPDGLAGLVLAGQTELLARLARRSRQALRNRLQSHFHLRGLNLAEASELLAQSGTRLHLSSDDLSDLHRKLLGNPRQLAQFASRWISRPDPQIPRDQPAEPSPPAEAPESTGKTRMGVSTARPPLRLDEGVIEVGYPESELDALPATSDAPAVPANEPFEDDETLTISDPYADIQSRQEWEQLRGRIGVLARQAAPSPAASTTESNPRSTRLRPETPHDPVPASRLFTRLENGPYADGESS